MSKEDHLRQAQKNEQFAYSIGDGAWDKIPYRDWVLTALFYSAVHLVDAYLETQGYRAAGSHIVRNRYIERLSELRSLREYDHLQFDSENARYDLAVPTARELKEVHVPRLEHIKKEIARLLR